MKCFDLHLHSSAEEPLSTTFAYHKDYLEGTDAIGAALLSIPSHADGKPYGKTSYIQNPKALFYKLAMPLPTYAFLGLEHNQDLTEAQKRRDFLRQAEEYHAAGADGIKLLEGKPSLRRVFPETLSDPVYEDAFAFWEEKGIPVLLHNADPAFYWDKDKVQPWHITLGWYVEETQLRKHEMLADVMTVLSRHPRLRLTMAHMGFTSDSLADAEAFLAYPNTSLDVTPGAEQLLAMAKEWEVWHPFFLKHKSRILYGTDRDGRESWDTPDWRDDKDCAALFLRNFFLTDGEHAMYGEPFRGVKLEGDVAEHIFYKNALALLGEPRPVDTAYFTRKLAEAEALSQNDPHALADIAFMKETLP